MANNKEKSEKEDSKRKSKEDNDKNDKGKSDSKRVLIIVLIIIGLILILFGLFLLFLKFGYWVYQNSPGNPENLNPLIIPLPSISQSSNSVKQFYPNIKFNHNDITYRVDSECDDSKKLRVVNAFDSLQNDIGNVRFYSAYENPDIDILCSGKNKVFYSEESDFFIPGEGGPRELIQTGRYNVIVNGTIFLYDNFAGSISCDWPNIEIHEIIHVFGFNHSEESTSLMFPFIESCEQRLDDSIINELKRLYSEPNLPDLYFENVSAVKRGRYVDFSFIIKNSGDINAVNVNFSVVENGKIVDSKELGDINFGSGVIMEIKNFRLLNRDSEGIILIIDYLNETEEIDKNNNVARINFK